MMFFFVGLFVGVLSMLVLRFIEWCFDPQGYRKWKWRHS